MPRVRFRALSPAVQALPGDEAVRMAVLLVLPVIGLEQVAHTTPSALVSYPVYEALHWLSDSLMALPLALAAVWGGLIVAYFLGHRRETLPDTVARALAIAVIFALLLVPGEALHEEADRLTQAHAALAIHTHGAAVPRTTDTPTLVLGYISHALSDGLQGQLLGLPVAILALWVSARAHRRAIAVGKAARGRAPPAAQPSGVITHLGGERHS